MTQDGRNSFQLFVGVLDTYLVWYLLVLPSEINAFTYMTSFRAIDGDTSYHSVNPSHCIVHVPWHFFQQGPAEYTQYFL